MSTHKRRRPTICLFFSHPLLGPELKRALPDDEFRLLFRRQDEIGAPGAGESKLPRAAVYVLEADARSTVTESRASEIVAAYPGAKILVVGEELEEANTFPLLRLGVKGILKFREVPTQLSPALHTISAGGFWVPRTLLSRFVEATLHETAPRRRLPAGRALRLSRRETEVLDLLLQNLSNKEIAKELNISARTAKFHVSNLLAKHGVRRRADLILLAHSRSAERPGAVEA